MADAANAAAPSSVPEGPSSDKRARSEEQAPVVALYSYWRSSSSYRVRIALNWKRIPFEYRAVHLVKEGGQQLKDAYAAVNPMKEVPTLIIHGRTLTQSAGMLNGFPLLLARGVNMHCLSRLQAIIEYLDDTFSERPLLPADPYLKFQVSLLPPRRLFMRHSLVMFHELACYDLSPWRG